MISGRSAPSSQSVHRFNLYHLDSSIQVETDAVSLYVDHGPEVAALHQQLQDCDRVLGRMEEMLHGFQADLGEISSEIKHLQEASLSMSVKLKNRRGVEDRLHIFLEQASLPPNIANQILNNPINETFQEAVVVLNKRLKYLEQPGAASDGSSLDVEVTVCI
jgi:vacuolar protein sorting-associated protein 52